MSNPPFYDCDTIRITDVSDSPTSVFSTRCLLEFTVDSSYYGDWHTISRPKEETKKEKLDRISRKKMLASWKKYNQKTPSIIKLKEICRPRNRISAGVFRGLR